MKQSRSYRQVKLYVLPGFTPTELGAAVDVFRVASRLTGHSLYRWDFVSTETRPISSPTGLKVSARAINDTAISPDLLVLLGGSGYRSRENGLARVVRWARRRNTQLWFRFEFGREDSR